MIVHRIAVAASVALLLFVSPAWADTTRGCSASVFFGMTGDGPTRFEDLASIEGRGACKNKNHANDCRAQARAQIDKCLSDLWNGRDQNAIPGSCKSLLSSSGRSGARLEYIGVYRIAEPSRLTARAAFRACCQVKPNAAKLNILFQGFLSGDKKCASGKVGDGKYQEQFFLPTYDMNCNAWRAQGICARP